ncbi:MAG: MFS transporter [Proteobacteria bacterium]|nr:MFS transporter [Pseudomonadota bacterium]
MPPKDKRILITILFSIFITVLGVGIVVPLLPVYAHTLGASGFMISMIFGSLSISRTLFLPYFGKRSDKEGRKPFIVAGLFSYFLVAIGFIISSSVHALIINRFFQGIAAAMIMPITQAYVADITPQGKEGRLMGIYNMAILGSLSLGPVFGGVINEHWGLGASFACMAGLSLVGFFLSIFFLPPVTEEVIQKVHSGERGWRFLLKDPMIDGIAAIRFAYVMCIGMIWCFLPVYADTEFFLSSSSIGILVMLGVLVSGLIQYPMGYLADRFNKNIMIVSGCGLIFIAMNLFVWARGFMDLFFINILFGLGGGICMPPVMAIAVIKGQAYKTMGSVMSLMTMAHSMGMLAGALLGGIIMDKDAIRHAFPIGALAILAGGIIFISCLIRDNKKRKAEDTRSF